ncbi:hypothetical protein [Corynebacterium nuruki]|uniref:hypothetical protein n=1 Tax=Corynebacterium nuruki TaxID=1032851 RepID=UPI0002487207|nr:hypothetical protein [Corynebacterium nuruki]
MSADRERRLLGWSHLKILIASPLATETERDVIAMLAIRGISDDNDGYDGKGGRQ